MNKELKQTTRAHSIFKRWKIRGSPPSQSSDDKEEKRDCYWIQNYKRAKSGHGTSIWYPSLLLVPIEYGISSGVFDAIDKEKDRVNRELKQTTRAHDVFKRWKIRGSPPSQSSDDKEEKSDHLWIQSKKQSKSGRGKYTWYPSLLLIAKEYGISSGVFDVIVNRELKQVTRAHDVFKRWKIRGNPPSQSSENKEEKRDCNWIQTQKQAKSGRGRYTWYPSLLLVPIEYGIPSAVFDVIDRVNRELKQVTTRAHDVFKRWKIRGSPPSQSSDDKEEKRDYSWIRTRKQARSGRTKYTWYPSLLLIPKEYGISSGVFQLRRK